MTDDNVADVVQVDSAGADGVPAPPAPWKRPAKLVALGAAFVLSAVGIGTAVGYGLRGGGSSNQAVAAAPAAHGPAYGAHSDGNHFGSLSDLLLPLPSGYRYGPDDLGLGDNTVLDRDQYEAQFSKSFGFLSSSDRQKLKNTLDLSHILGYGLRTFSDGISQTVEITLLQENQQLAKSMSTVTKDLAQSTGVFRAGPSIAGYPDAHCYLLPTSPGDPLESMMCDASVGDLLVTLEADGAAPLDQASAATILHDQLSRLAIPAAQI